MNIILNKRKELMQETQHIPQTATRTAQNQDKEQHECKWLQKNRRHTETNKHLLRERYGSSTLERSVTHVTGGLNLFYERSTSPSSNLFPTKRTV